MASRECVPTTPESEVEASTPINPLAAFHRTESGPHEEFLIVDSPTDHSASSFSSQDTSSTSYSFLRDLQTDLTMPGTSTVTPYILPKPASLHAIEPATTVMRDDPEFILIVRRMREELFSRKRGLVLGKDDPPNERAIIKAWTTEMKRLYGTQVTASVTHTRVSSYSF